MIFLIRLYAHSILDESLWNDTYVDWSKNKTAGMTTLPHMASKSNCTREIVVEVCVMTVVEFYSSADAIQEQKKWAHFFEIYTFWENWKHFYKRSSLNLMI